MRGAYETVLGLLLCMKESGRLDTLELVDLLKEGLMMVVVVVVVYLGLNGQTVFTTVSFTPRKPQSLQPLKLGQDVVV